MASYDAVIKLIVEGEGALKRIQERIDNLYKTISDLEKKKKFAGSEAAVSFVRDQADQLERVVKVSKDIIKQDEKRIVQQSKLNSAVDLYERRIKQVVNSGASDLKKFEGQIKEIEGAFKFFKDRGNVTAVQALATELGRMVEYANAVNRSERARASNLSQLRGFAKELVTYEEAGLDTKKAREKFDALALVADTNKTNEAKKYTEALLRQLKLLKDQLQTNTQIVKDMAGVTASLMKLEEKQRDLANSKLDQKALQIQVALDRQAAAAAESAAQVEKLNQRQAEFIARTDAAAQAASRQTAEFIRQQRIAKEVAKINANAPAPQLLLAPAAPGAPAMGGGARARITGPVERLGGARTQDEADMALRLAQNLKRAVPEASKLSLIFDTVENSLSNIVKLTSKQTKTTGATTKDGGMGRLFENLALGAGFPLLFGGGPGQILGGLLGSFVGTGFGGQILGSAIFGQLEQLGVAANEAGAALQKPIDNFNIIKDRAILASNSQDKYVQRLIESGQFIEATTAIQRRYNDVVGREGSANLLELAKASDRLNRAWGELGLQIQAAIAGPLAGFVEWLAGFLQLTNNARRGAAAESQLTPDQRAEIAGRRQALERGRQRGTLFGGLTPQQALREEQAIARRVQELAGSNQPRQADTGFRATETAQLASLERQATIQSQLTKLTDTRLQLSSKQLQTDISVLNKQQELTTSLNQQTSIINEIAQVKNAAAQTELALTQSQQRLAVQNAQLDLKRAEARAAAAAEEMRQLQAAGQLKEERRAELQAVMEQAVVARQNLSTTEQIAYYTNQSAASQAAAAQYMADIERRQAIVNAYAEDYARINAETTRKIEEQTNAINNRATLLNAISQATQTLNNIEIQGLERELERTTNAGKRKAIIEEIYKLEVENARVQLEATRANIQAELARADAAYRTVQLKYEELRAVVKIAEAQGVVTRAHYEALRAQESALRIAADNLDVANKVANLQWKAADAVYEAAVDAAELKKEMAGTAEAAGTFAGNMERAVGAISGVSGALGGTTQGAPFAAFGGAMGIEDPELRKQAMAIWDAATKFAEGKDYKVMQDIFQKARDDIAALIARGGAPEKRTVNIKDLQDEIDKVYEEMRSGEYMTQKSHLEDIEERRKAFLESINLGEGGKQMQELQTEQDEKYKKLLESATGATESVDGATEAITTMAAAFETMRESILAFAEPTATDTKSNPAPGSIPLTAPLASGLSMQPGGGPGTAIIDTMPTINLQTGPVLQQENGEKYVRLGDLETILQDFAATVFNNARSTGGRRFQGVN